MDTKSFKDAQNNILRSVLNTRIYDLVRETPLSYAPKISALTDNNVYLKREDMQEVFSFKIRGAYHKMVQLPPEQLRRGIVAASAGNHAQGVALAARHLGYKAVIVMPVHVQNIKMEAVSSYGAEIVLHGDSFDEVNAFALELAAKRGAVVIPPFDDADIIAGNGTIAAEILRQHSAPLDVVFCAVGGGGLISGVACYIKSVCPDVRIIGVESEESASMSASLQAGHPVQLPYVGSFADAVAIKKPGQLTFTFVQKLVDEIITVSNDELCAAIKDSYEDTRVIFEPAGALAVSGLKKYTATHKIHKKNMIALACGANMNFERLGFVVEHADIGEQREAIFAAIIPEKPGSFKNFCALLGERNITEFNYRLDNKKNAHIFVGIEIKKHTERKEVVKELRDNGLSTVDLTDNEMAKLHIRYLVGGRVQAEHEVLYRFEFPERPGSLGKFLNLLYKSNMKWNISLFHYRNNGGDTSRVLAGIQVPLEDRTSFMKALEELNYPYCCETDNPAYKLFLQGNAC